MQGKQQTDSLLSPILEALEPRLLLDGDLTVFAADYQVGPSVISAQWFASVEHVGVDGSAATAGSPTATVETISWAGLAADVRAGQWIVRLTDKSIAGVSSVSETAGLLSGGEVAFEVVRGLGMAGRILVQTYGSDVETVSAWLSENPNVGYFEPDYVYYIDVIPIDADFDQQWGLHNTGQTGGTADADIDAPEAWDITLGGNGIVVAVIDSGVDYTHPDLAGNMWMNPGEIAGDGIDNDSNGFTDDVYGWDFYDNDNDPLDELYHGTHVAGIIAADANSLGVVGVGWETQIMALKVGGDDSTISSAAAISALNYASMMRETYGVNVVLSNNSWGGGGYNQTLRDAIEASGNAGMLFIGAAGNGGLDGIGDNNDVYDYYPSGYSLDNIIAVAATNDDDGRAGFSNYGATTVDLGAPGVGILSTFPTYITDQMSLYGLSTDYETISGTSMATPHVSGVAALIWATTPASSYQSIRGAIFAGVDPVASMSGITVTGGRLNALGALQNLSLMVVGGNPGRGDVVSVTPTEFVVNFSHDYLPGSVDASDFTVNGIAADTFALYDGNTVTFTFAVSPVTVEGPQVMAIADGAILRDGDSDPIVAWQGTFYYDLLTLAVTSTSPTGGQTLSSAPTSIILNFNETVDAWTVDVGDLILSEDPVIAVVAVDTDTLSYTVTGLIPEGEVTYTLVAGAITDAHGTPNALYVGQFTIDDPLIEAYESTDVPQSINDYYTTTSTLIIGDSFTIGDVDVVLDIDHTYDSDLTVYLTAPGGTEISLFANVGGSGSNFENTVLDG